ncbi:unnamed protein product, partial [Adineta steineri]
SIIGYQLVSFKTSHLITSDDEIKSFIKQELTQTYIDAGIRVSSIEFYLIPRAQATALNGRKPNEKIVLLITEEEFQYLELIINITNIINAEDISSLFSLQEETTV